MKPEWDPEGDALGRGFSAHGRVVKFRRGEALVSQAEGADTVVRLTRGSAEVRVEGSGGRELILTTLGPGDVFGELGVLAGGSRSASVVARSAGEAIMLHRDRFLHLLQNDPAFSKALLEDLARRMVRLTEQVKILGLKSGWKRIAAALLFFKDSPAHRPERLTITYLAPFCGVSFRQAQRILRQLAARGWVALATPDSADIQVTNRAGLEGFAGK